MPKSFPTAEGYGANSVGGRGGAVYEVTKLTDDGSVGTFRYGVERPGPRNIVFRVDGTIPLTNNITIKEPYITIAGQTAPGMGIQLKNYNLRISTHDVIIRFIRIRPGVDAISPSTGRDTNALLTYGPYYVCTGNVSAGSRIVSSIAQGTGNFRVGMQFHYSPFFPLGTTITSVDSSSQITVNNPSSGTGSQISSMRVFDVAYNIMLDHCDAQWSSDQNMDVGENAWNVTQQWCIAAEGLNIGHSIATDSNGNIQKAPWLSHSCGGIAGHEPYYGTMKTVTCHHCVWTQSGSRQPLATPWSYGGSTGVPDATGPMMRYDFRNNIIHNWSSDGGPSVFTVPFYTQFERDRYKAALGWPNTAGFEVNIVGCYWSERFDRFNNSDGCGWVSECVKLYMADNTYRAADPLPILGPMDGFGVPSGRGFINRADNGASGSTLWAKWPNYDATPFRALTPYSIPAYAAVTTTPGSQVLATVLATVGPSRVFRNGAFVSIRDAVDTRLVTEIQNRAGSVGGSASYSGTPPNGTFIGPVYPTLTAGVAPTDTDHDGIPDAWATAHGLSPTGNPGPQLAADGSGYTNLEQYINELAGDGAAPPSGGGDVTPPAPPTGVTIS